METRTKLEIVVGFQLATFLLNGLATYSDYRVAEQARAADQVALAQHEEAVTHLHGGLAGIALASAGFTFAGLPPKRSRRQESPGQSQPKAAEPLA